MNIDYSNTVNYTMPMGDCGVCRLICRKDDLIKIVDVDCGAILWVRPEWIVG